MMIDLVCPNCPFHFRAPSDTLATEILDRMIEDGPWVALGEGENFEEMILAALHSRGAIRCPDCQEVVAIENLGRASREMLVCC